MLSLEKRLRKTKDYAENVDWTKTLIRTKFLIGRSFFFFFYTLREDIEVNLHNTGTFVFVLGRALRLVPIRQIFVSQYVGCPSIKLIYSKLAL